MLKNYTKIKIDEFGNKFYLNDEGCYHRLDGPAIECSNGTKEWFINENCHRNIDPSDEWPNRVKQWWFKGEYHRVGGSSSSYSKWWFIDGKQYTKQEYFNIVWDL